MLSNKEKEWLKTIKFVINNSDQDYYVSWWLRIDLNIPTKRINYWLSKLATKGYLKKVAEKTHTKYFLLTKDEKN